MGLVRLDGLPAVSVITWLSPEIVMLCTSVVILMVCTKLVRPQEQTTEEGEVQPKPPKKRKYGFLVTIGKQ